MATFTLTTGDDSLVGTDGDDIFWDRDDVSWSNVNRGRDLVDGGAGWDVLYADGDLTGDQFTGIEELRYGSYAFWTLITIDQLNEFQRLSPQVSLLFIGGGGGNVDVSNRMDEGTAITLVAGDAVGAVRFHGTSRSDTLIGSAFGDTLIGGSGNDYLDGDFTFTWAGSSFDFNSEDRLYGGQGNDDLRGGDGNDSLFGGSGDDRIDAGAGNDIIFGGQGVDTMEGGAGDDVYHVDSRSDVVTEWSFLGAGTDTVRASVSWSLGDNVENLVLTGGKWRWGDGNALDNAITGNFNRNVLSGKDGDDTLNGRGGADTLWGGAGDDRFVFDTTLNGRSVDTIKDFGNGNDVIVLGTNVFTALDDHSSEGGALDVSAFEAGNGVARSADARILYNTATGALAYDADGSGSGAALQFALLQPNLTLTADDFDLV